MAFSFFLGWELSPPPMFSLSSGFGYNSNWLASMATVLVRTGIFTLPLLVVMVMEWISMLHCSLPPLHHQNGTNVSWLLASSPQAWYCFQGWICHLMPPCSMSMHPLGSFPFNLANEPNGTNFNCLAFLIAWSVQRPLGSEQKQSGCDPLGAFHMLHAKPWLLATWKALLWPWVPCGAAKQQQSLLGKSVASLLWTPSTLEDHQMEHQC